MRSIDVAQLSDAPFIAALAAELGYPTTSEVIRKRMQLLLDRPDHLVLVASDQNANVIGWMHIERRISLEGGEKAEVLGLVVARSQRRTGVGRQLMAEGEKWAFEQGLVLVVRSNINRNEAHGFYQGLGYELAKTQHVYRKLPADRIGMVEPTD